MNLRTNLVLLVFVLIFAAGTGVRAESPMLDDQIRTAFENAYPDCAADREFQLMPIHISGGPTINGTWKCAKGRKVYVRVILAENEGDIEFSRRMWTMRSIMPPTRKIESPGVSPVMVTTNGRVEIQFSKANLIHTVQTEFPPDKSKKGAYYYHTASRNEEKYALDVAHVIAASAEGERVFEVCRNTFAWPVRDFGFEPEDQLFSAIVQGNVEKVKRLVDSNVSLEAKFGRPYLRTSGDEGNQPLHNAVIQGCIRTIEIMVEAGAKVNARAAAGMTPLMLAAGSRNLEAFDYLISKGADIRAKTDWGMNVAHYVVTNWIDRSRGVPLENKLAALESILNKAKAAGIDFDERDSNNGNSLLGLQMETCDGSDWCLKITQILIGYGVNVNSLDSSGRSPLYKTIERSHTQQDLKVVRLLIKSGADPNIKTRQGQSLIGYLDRKAVIYANDESSQKAIAVLKALLIEAGAKP